MSGRPLIRVQNAQRKLRVDIELMQKFAARALRLSLDLPSAVADAICELAEVTVVFVSDRRIAALHKKFLNIPGATDVLTFHHGEIVVSVETAQHNAKRFGCSAEDEIKLYVIHGLLHLLGFDDKTAEEAHAMEIAQARVLLAMQEPNDL